MSRAYRKYSRQEKGATALLYRHARFYIRMDSVNRSVNSPRDHRALHLAGYTTATATTYCVVRAKYTGRFKLYFEMTDAGIDYQNNLKQLLFCTIYYFLPANEYLDLPAVDKLLLLLFYDGTVEISS